MNLIILDHDRLQRSTDVVTYILFEIECLHIIDLLLELEVIAVHPHCVHVESFRDVQVDLERSVELGQSLQSEYHRVQSYGRIDHQRQIANTLHFNTIYIKYAVLIK